MLLQGKWRRLIFKERRKRVKTPNELYICMCFKIRVWKTLTDYLSVGIPSLWGELFQKGRGGRVKEEKGEKQELEQSPGMFSV